MSFFNKRTVTVDGIRVEVLEAGSGEPLVYLHGAGSTSGFQELSPQTKGVADALVSCAGKTSDTSNTSAGTTFVALV